MGLHFFGPNIPAFQYFCISDGKKPPVENITPAGQ